MIYINMYEAINFHNDTNLHHRLNGPALFMKRCHIWYVNGQYHRLDGPAVIYSNNDQEWYKNGNRHRLDGPAVIKGNYQSWWVDGVKYSEPRYHDKLKEMGLT